MTDKQIIVDGVDMSGCSYGEIEKDMFKCSCEYNVRSASMFCKDNPNCYYKQLKAKEQECDELKKTLIEIKEIAEGMHDLWINKTPYTDINNLVEHLLECELNRIRYKLDEISEVGSE